MNDRTVTAGCITDYASFLRAQERAPATIEKYLRDIRAFASWLADRPVTRERTVAWKARLLDRGCAPVTVNTKLSAVNGLLRFLGWEDCRVKLLRLQRRLFRDASRELDRTEYHRLLETAAGQGRERLALLMQTICAAGIRVSELRYITVQAARSGRADVALKGKVRTILLPGRLCRKLLKYAKKQKIASGEIFLTGDGKSIPRHRVWREMKALCKAAGVAESKVFPHNLRHLFASAFYRATGDIVKLADVLGHSSVETTRIYLRSTGEEHVRQLEKLGLLT